MKTMKYIEIPDKKQEEVLRRMTGEDRMRIGFEICEFVWKLVISGIRYKFPHISEKELVEKIIERYQVWILNRLQFQLLRNYEN